MEPIIRVLKLMSNNPLKFKINSKTKTRLLEPTLHHHQKIVGMIKDQYIIKKKMRKKTLLRVTLIFLPRLSSQI
jgi:hypothetical protein